MNVFKRETLFSTIDKYNQLSKKIFGKDTPQV
jgi:hypothetical protein